MERVSGEDMVTYAEELAPELEQVFEDRYDIACDTPAFKRTRAGYCQLGTAMKYVAPHQTTDRSGPGIVKMREDIDWFVPEFVGSLGHEMGHAALYQNTDFGELRQDGDYDDFILDCISEGVAQRFQRDTFHYYMRNGGNSVADRASYWGVRTVGNVIRAMFDLGYGAADFAADGRWRSDYSHGRELFRGTSTDTVTDILCDPDAYYHDIKDSV